MSAWWFVLDLKQELAALPDDETRKRIWEDVEKQGDRYVNQVWWVVLGNIAVYLLGKILGAHLWTIAGPLRFGWQRVWGWGFGLAFVIAFSLFAFWRFRRLYQRLLRERINAEGIPICLHCGYNLTGLPPAQHCPECGGARAAKPVQHASAEAQSPTD